MQFLFHGHTVIYNTSKWAGWDDTTDVHVAAAPASRSHSFSYLRDIIDPLWCQRLASGRCLTDEDD